MGLIRLFSRQIVFGIGRKVEVNLRQKLFDHLLIQDPEWIQKKGSGDIISRATSDVENIRRLLGFTVLSLCNIVLAYSFTIPSMFSINRTLTISALMIFPLILGIVSLFGGRMVKQRKAQQESLSKLSDLIQEDLSGISAIKIYAQENAEKKEFKIHNNAYRNSAIKLARTASTLFPLLQGISSISLLILLSLGTFQLESGFISIGGLVALILYVERLVFPTALLGFTLNTFQLGQVSLDRVEEIFQNYPNIEDREKTKFLKKKVKGLLEAKNLTIKYPGSKFNSLNGLNFKINPGELIAIVGPVGCGKTTLAKSLGRTIEIPDNQLFLDEIDLKTNLATELASKYGKRVLLETIPFGENEILCSSFDWWIMNSYLIQIPEQIIIPLLPIPNMSEPINAIIVSHKKKLSKDWFRDFFLPQARIKLERSISPLRRNSGKLIILDGRVNKRNWGRLLLQNIQPSKKINYMLPFD